MTLAAWPRRRPHQIRALAHLAAAYKRTDRAQLHWACGTGKTLVGRWLAEEQGARTAVVFLPSLALVAQALAEWQTASPWPFEAIVVCSDPTTADSWQVDRDWWAEHHVRVTTDRRPVTEFLRARSEIARVVFSTYHSAPVVADAARVAGVTFDLAVCDEAHRLAGAPDARFRTVLHDHELRCRRRLFVTATPIYAEPGRASGLLSMSDVAVFGPVADRLDFAEAIDSGLLVDYQVLVLDAAGEAGQLDDGTVVPAALAAAAREGLTRVISYHSRVSRARRFAGDIDGLRLPDQRAVRARAVAGADPTSTRRAALDELRDGAADTLSVLANARCLTEGVDVPAVDGVIFADPKTSDTDIVQAIGRALRPAPGKTRGLIILPVVLSDAGVDEDLSGGAFSAVWGVLRALRSLDPRIAAELTQMRRWTRAGGGAREGAGGRGILRFDLGDVDLSTLAARIIDPTGFEAPWAEMLELLRAWVKDKGHTGMLGNTAYRGKPLGRWVVMQRRAYAADALPFDRVARLNVIPGWAWTLDGAWWAHDRAMVAAIAAEHGGLHLNDDDFAGIQVRKRTDRSILTIGRWCAQQRRAYRDLDLDEASVAACQSIQGWSWTAGVPERDAEMVDALAEWVELRQDANVPHEARWGSRPLGAFITAVRRRAVMGRLALPLAEDIALVTPHRPNPGTLDWQQRETLWGLNYLALRQYAARTGGCDIPEHGTEDFNGWTSHLYAWATRQRHLHRHGHLEPERATLLEEVPGWAWERERKVRVLVGIGARQHGTRLGYAAGCLCEDCTAANTAYEAERQRRKAAGEPTTDRVDPGPARAHLRILEGQIGKRARPAMQQVTGLNKKTIDEVINGDRGRITPEVDAALRALTVEGLLEHITANPSTRDELPAAPTLALVDDLVRRGWPKAWISREIGGAGRALQIGKSGTGVVRRETADAIAALHAAVGDLRPPPRQWRTGLPTLAELTGATEQAVA